METAFLAPTPVVRHQQRLPLLSPVNPRRNVAVPRAKIELPAEPVNVVAQKALRSLRLNGKRTPTYLKLQTKHRSGPREFRHSVSEELTKPANGIRQVKRHMLRDGIALTELAIGSKLRGVVQNMLRHGVYVDVGAVTDGLVHVRDMSVDFVHDPRDLVRSGDTVDVWVKYVDTVKNVLGLSMVKPTKGFGGRIDVANVKIGVRYRGIVERVTNYGAYVDVGAERLAFLHVLGIWGKKPREGLDMLRLGEAVWVEAVEVDVVKSFIRLLARDVEGGRLGEFGPIGEMMVSDGGGEVAATSIARKGDRFKMWEEGDDDEEGAKGYFVEEDVDDDEEDVGEEDEDEDGDDVDDEFASMLDDIDDQDVEEFEAELGQYEGSAFSGKDVAEVDEIEQMLDDDTELLGQYRDE